MNPKVSVIMGVYNGSNYVARAIDSIIKQTYTNWEFIICDDCSSDSTWDILNSYADKDNRIRIIQNKNNLGLAETLNKCIEISKGKYIARQDDDDISLPARLNKQIKFLEENKDYAMVGSNAYLINNIEEEWGAFKYSEKPTKNDLIKGSPFIHPTILIRKEILDEVGGYDKDKLRVEDYDLWFRLYAKGYKGYNLQEHLIKYTLDLNSYKKRKYRYRINEFKVRVNGYRINQLNTKSYIYAIKPLIVGLIPGRIIYKIQMNKV